MFEIFRFLSKAQNDKHLFVILTCQNDKIRRHRKMAVNVLQAFKLGACGVVGKSLVIGRFAPQV